MPTAEWYEEQARKSKLGLLETTTPKTPGGTKGWAISDRFTAYDKIGLTLAEKYKVQKPFYLAVDNDPKLKANLGPQAKEIYTALKKYNPDYFKTAQPIVPPKTTFETTQASTANKIAQAAASGIAPTNDIAQQVQNIKSINQPIDTTPNQWSGSTIGAAKPGQLEFLNKTKLAEKTIADSKASKFWAWTKKEFEGSLLIPLMQAMNLPFKATTDIFLKNEDMSDKWAAEQLGITYEDFVKAKTNPDPSKRFIFSPTLGRNGMAAALKVEVIKKAPVDEQLKWIKESLKGTDTSQSKVEGTGWKDIVGYILPELNYDYEWAKDQNDWWKGFNFIQKTAATIAPTPAALAGFVAEVKAIDLPGLKIGTEVGAKTGVKTTEKILAKGGETVLETGRPLALGEVARATIAPTVKGVTKSAVEGFIKAKKIPVKQLLTEAGVDVSTKAGKKFFKQMKTVIGTNVDAYGRGVTNDLIQTEARKLAATLPIAEAKKLFDFGGVSIKNPLTGGNVQLIAGSVGADIKNSVTSFVTGRLSESALGESISKAIVKLDDTVKGLFSTNKNIPIEFQPYNSFVKSAMRKETEVGFGVLKKIRDTLDPGKGAARGLFQRELDVFDRFVKTRRDMTGLMAEIQELQAKIKAGNLSPSDYKKVVNSIASKIKLIEYGKFVIPDASIMSDKVRRAIQQYDTEFVQDFLQKTEQRFGVEYKVAGDYTPIRDVAGKTTFGSKVKNLLGSETAKFQKEYEIGGYLKNVKLGNKTIDTIMDSIRKGKSVVEIADDLNLKPKDVRAYTKAKSVFATPATKGFMPVGEASGTRVLEHTTRVGRNMLIDEGKMFGMVDDGTRKIPNGWVEVRDTNGKLIPELRTMKFSPDMADVFKRVEGTFFGDNSFVNTLKFLDTATNIWKRLVLATPGYHLRNFYSDITSGYVEWGNRIFNPQYWSDASKIKKAQIMGGKSPELLNAKIKVGGETVTVGEVIDTLGQSGITGTGLTAVESAMKIQSKFANYNLLQWNAKVGMAREDMGRIVGYLVERDAGSDMIQAATKVKKVFFDYLDLTAFERQIARRAIPFYTWQRKNIARQIEVLITRPQQIAKINAYVNSVTGKKPEGYDFLQPEYYKELYTFVSQGKSDSGEVLTQRLNLPIEDIAALNPKLGLDRLTSGVNPYLKMFAEAGVYGVEKFTGKDLTSKNLESAPGIVKSAFGNLSPEFLSKMGITKAGGTGEGAGELLVTPLWNYMYRWIPQLYMAERAMPQDESPKTLYNIESMVLGIKRMPWEDEKQKNAYYKKTINDINDWIDNQNITLGGSKDSGFIPSINDMEKGYKQLYYDYLNKQYPKYAEAEAIKEKIKYEGGGNADITQMVKNMQKDYLDEKDKLKNKNFVEIMVIAKNAGLTPTLDEIKAAINIYNSQ